MSTDSFTNSDETALTSHTPLTYTEINSLGISRATIVSNQVTTGSGDNGQFSFRIDADTRRSMKIDFLNHQSKRVCVACGSATSGYYFYYSNLSAGDYADVTLERNGSFLSITTMSSVISQTASSASARIDAPVNGSQVDIEIFSRGTSEETYTDSSASRITDGNPGAIIFYNGETRTDYDFDNLDTTSLDVDGALLDSFDVSDSLISYIVRGRLLSESVAVSDSIISELILAVIARILSDSLSVSDSIKAYKSLSRSLSDTSALSELIISYSHLNRTLIDEVALSEFIFKVLNVNRTLTDTVVLSESILRIFHLDRTLVENISLFDSLISSAVEVLLRVLSDSIPVEDALSSFIVIGRQLLSTLDLDEAILTQLGLNRSLADTLNVNDSIEVRRYLERVLLDQFDIPDSIISSILPFLTFIIDFILTGIVDRIPAIVDRNNRFIYSEDFNEYPWDGIHGACIVTSTKGQIDPFGGIAADRIEVSSGGGACRFGNDSLLGTPRYFIVDTSIDTTLNISFFTKQGTELVFPVQIFNVDTPGNIVTGTFTYLTEALDISGIVEDWGNGWYRVSFDFNDSDSSGFNDGDSILVQVGFVSSYSVGDYYDVFGAQLTYGPGMLPYQKTAGGILVNSPVDAEVIVTDIAENLNIKTGIKL